MHKAIEKGASGQIQVNGPPLPLGWCVCAHAYVCQHEPPAQHTLSLFSIFFINFFLFFSPTECPASGVWPRLPNTLSISFRHTF